MAVGAGSIKRASKLNAEATEGKAAVTAEAPVKKSSAKSSGTKSAAAKTTAKKTTTAKKAALPKEEPVTNIMVPTPEVMQEVVKIASSHKVCRLTEDLPVHLL